MAKEKPPTDFRKALTALMHGHDARRVFDGFTILAACALSCQTREEEYLAEARRWKAKELDTFGKALGALVNEMQERPFEDLLGDYYMEFCLSDKGKRWNAEFHTPQCLSDMMAQMLMQPDELPKEGVITVLEPACGAGAMILGVGKAVKPDVRRRLRVTGIDINKTACDMTFINTTLWGIPTRIIHGNSISLEFWKGWDNIHWVCPWLPLAMTMRPDPAKQGAPPPPAEVEMLKRSLKQGELPL